MRTRVKICGITCSEDALAAVAAGADAIGLVFYAPSSRVISAEKAREIVHTLPAFVTTVGLFVNPTPDEVHDVLAQVELDCLQFHGEETADFCELFTRPYIKAIRMKADTDIEQAAVTYRGAKGLLLDTYVEDIPGGTGQVFDWDKIPAERRLPLILAGGLNVENVAQAIKRVRPYAVDVSGGVERAKGIKDHDKIRAFIREVNRVGAG